MSPKPHWKTFQSIPNMIWALMPKSTGCGNAEVSSYPFRHNIIAPVLQICTFPLFYIEKPATSTAFASKQWANNRRNQAAAPQCSVFCGNCAPRSNRTECSSWINQPSADCGAWGCGSSSPNSSRRSCPAKSHRPSQRPAFTANKNGECVEWHIFSFFLYSLWLLIYALEEKHNYCNIL